MTKFDLTVFDDDIFEAQYAYDNLGAYNQLQTMMRGGEKIRVEFHTSKQDNTPYAWVESKSVAGFRYILKEESQQGLIHYLEKGIVSDFDPDPSEFKPIPENTPKFEEELVRKFIEEGMVIQWIPFCRERSKWIKGIHSCKKGKIYFWIARNEENIDYLRENKMAI